MVGKCQPTFWLTVDNTIYVCFDFEIKQSKMFYVFQDDLRKDCRLMEFNGIVNKFLRKDPESRKRSLNIRTYVRACSLY